MLKQIVKNLITFAAKEAAKAYFDEYQNRYPFFNTIPAAPQHREYTWSKDITTCGLNNSRTNN